MRHPMMRRLTQTHRGVPYQPFKDVPEAAKVPLENAFRLEARAGEAVRDGKLKTAEQFREEARKAWAAARSAGL